MLLTRGYCEDRDGAIWLAMAGVSASDIYCKGRGAESLARCVNSFRGCAGLLYTTCATPRLRRNIRVIRLEISDILRALMKAKTLRRMFAAIP